MNSFDEELARRLAAIRDQDLRRELQRVDSPQSPRLRIDGRTLLNFSSNDYLGLANEPALKEAAIRAIERFGAGSGSSRLIAGSLAPHHELEETLAQFKGAEAALTFSTGYATAIGTLTALAAREDVVIIDKLVHASLIDAARLSGAKLRVFDHNDLNDLESILRWADSRASLPRSGGAARSSHTLIVAESIFSMDGDRAPLREIVGLKEKYGAWLMVDEAHATGLCGTRGRGLVEELKLSDQIEIQMGTLGKAIGASGGYICGSRTLIDYLVNRARSFIFSTAPVPAAAAAAAAGIRLIDSNTGEQRRRTLEQRCVEAASLRTVHGSPGGAILPVIIGDEAQALATAASLRDQGIFVPAIRYPTVARGAARLRITLTAAHSAADVRSLATALETIRTTEPA